jgi:FkbM family methyltransferase
MSVSQSQELALTGIYSLVRRSGLLSTSPGRWLFSRAYFVYKRYLEDPFHGLISQHPQLFQGGHILDIGANIGYTSSLFSGAIGESYRVYSFEPEPFNFRLLEKIAAAPRARGRIAAFQSAVGNQDGTIELWINKNNLADHRIVAGSLRESKTGSASVQAPILKIDTFVERQGSPFPVRFIKIDVQGYETAVCQGMEQTLSKNPDAVVALEYSPDSMRDLGFQPEDLLDWFRAKGYICYSLHKNGALSQGTPTAPQKGGYCDLVFSRAEL